MHFPESLSHVSLNYKVQLTANLNKARTSYVLQSVCRLISCTVNNWWRERELYWMICAEVCLLGDFCRSWAHCSCWYEISFSILILPSSLFTVTYVSCRAVSVTDSWFVRILSFRIVCGVLQAWTQPMNISRWLCIIITRHGGLKRSDWLFL
jgi:hypothetical protein